MPQTAVTTAIKAQKQKANLNVQPMANLFVLGAAGDYVLGGYMMFPAPGTVFSAVPRLGMPILAGRVP